MKIVIDIPEEDYKFIQDLQFYNSGRRSGRTIEQNVINGIRNGKPYEERPQGEWIEVKADISKDILYHIECSNCGAFGLLNEIRHYYFSDYCPFCGADMEGENHD